MTDETSTTAHFRALTGADLAVVVLEVIEENLDRWNQGAWRQDVTDEDWITLPCDDDAPATAVEHFPDDPLNPACKTAFCEAGWVAALDGVKWRKGSGEHIGNPDECDCTTPCCINHDHEMHVSEYARLRLNLDSYEGDLLFNGDNSLEDLRRYTAQLEAGERLSKYDEDDDDEDEEDYEEDDDEIVVNLP